MLEILKGALDNFNIIPPSFPEKIDLRLNIK